MRTVLARHAAAALLGAVLALPVSAESLTGRDYGRIDVAEAQASLPESSENTIEEARLLDNGDLGMRVFRIYGPVPEHHHTFSDTFLKVLGGEAEIAIDGKKPFTVIPGDVVFWRAGVPHAVFSIAGGPVDFLSIDTPTRREGDVVRADH